MCSSDLKLLAQLPPTRIHYRFRMYDADEFNGFSLAGGYIYLSRKLPTAKTKSPA